jgi:hypothetical protein
MVTDEQIVKLKEANPGAELTLIQNDDVGIEVVVKTPDDGTWKRFRSQSSDDAQRSVALRGLVLSCVVHPAGPDFASAVARRPGIIETIGGKLVEVAGVSMATTARKL